MPKIAFSKTADKRYIEVLHVMSNLRLGSTLIIYSAGQVEKSHESQKPPSQQQQRQLLFASVSLTKTETIDQLVATLICWSEFCERNDSYNFRIMTEAVDSHVQL